MSSEVWNAWRAGEFFRAREQAGLAIKSGRDMDEAHHVLALVAHVLGEHTQALDWYERLNARYKRLAELDEPVLWSYVRLGEVEGACAFAERRKLLKRASTRHQLKLAVEMPLCVDVTGVRVLPFVEDGLSAVMPGVEGRLNDTPVIVRLDTGGSFVHVTRSQADALGIAYAGGEKAFAALTTANTWHGVATLELGGACLVHVPVCVHEDNTLPVQLIASAFGAELGPIIGTSVFEQFFTTIDSPGKRLVISARADRTTQAAHLERLRGQARDVPFALLGSHFMLAKGRLGGARELNLFIDSGIAAFNTEQGQAALLASSSTLRAWGMPKPKKGRFAELAQALALGSVERQGMSAVEVSDGTWKRFGDWNGLRVDALLSQGFLKYFAFTLDFERQVFTLRG